MARRAPYNPNAVPYSQKNAVLTDPDEIEWRDDNVKAREHYQDEAIKELICAVALKAVEDYKMTTFNKKREDLDLPPRPGSLEEECLIFFRSPMFKEATGCTDSEKMIRLIKDADIRQIRNAMRIELGYERRKKDRSATFD